MSWFSPYKKRPNKFTYVPRYYDPEKEARELRRAELRGERSDDAMPYEPGKYIRTQREAREQRRASRDDGQGRMAKLILLVAVVMLAAYIFIPQLVGFFSQVSKPRTAQPVEQYDDFDPSAPITIVPNDYQE